MEYEKQILPLDNSGNFILAIHFSRYVYHEGCTREYEHAYFGYGNAANPNALSDITSLFCLERLPNRQEAERHFKHAEFLRQSGSQDQAWQFTYKARNALKPSVYVPQTVLTGRNGKLFIGIDAGMEDIQAGLETFVLRVIDVFHESITSEYREVDVPMGLSKTYPMAFSSDAQSLIINTPANIQTPLVAEHFLSDKRTEARFEDIPSVRECVLVNGHWIVKDMDYVYTFPIGSSEAANRFKLPEHASGWLLSCAQNCYVIALSGDSGRIVIMDCESGMVRNYFPHRGCRRDNVAEVKLSSDGLWMVSKLRHQTELVMTCLSSGESWKVDELKDEVMIEHSEGDFRSTSRIPAAFNFINDRLLVSDSKEVREIDMARPSDDLVFMSEQGKDGARIPAKFDTFTSVENLLEQAKLDRVLEIVRDQHYPACLITSTPSDREHGWGMPGDKGSSDLGESRLGGWPDLPDGMDWPMWHDRPMSFLAQINLTDASKVQPDIRLPKSGVLLFFFGCRTDTFKRDPFKQKMYCMDILAEKQDEQGGNVVRVIHAEPETVLSRTRYDGEILPELYSPCKVTLKSGGMPLPYECTAAYDQIPLNDSERDFYNDVLDNLESDEYADQLSGYPMSFQGGYLENEPENLSRGRSRYYQSKDENERRDFNQAAARWGMLLQLTSCNNINYSWCNGGHLYIYGPRAEIENGIFDNCHATVEC